MLLKPASPTPSNTGLVRSFQRNTEKGIKVLLYCKVLQRGGAYVYRCATRIPRVTSAGTYDTGRAPLRRCTWLHLILLSIHKTATDRRWEMSHSNTPLVRNRAPLTARSSRLRCVSAAEHLTAEQYFKTGITKPRKHLPRSDLSWNMRQDFIKIPSLCEAALENASQRSSLNQMSLPK